MVSTATTAHRCAQPTASTALAVRPRVSAHRAARPVSQAPTAPQVSGNGTGVFVFVVVVAVSLILV